MRFVPADDLEALALRDELAAQSMDTDAAELSTANLWLCSVEGSVPDARALIAEFFAHPGMPYRDLLEPHIAQAPWTTLPPEAALVAAIRLLTTGVSLEIPPFHHEQAAAESFAERLFQWIGSPKTIFANVEHRADRKAVGFGVFQTPQCIDEGLILIGSKRLALLWFVGAD